MAKKLLKSSFSKVESLLKKRFSIRDVFKKTGVSKSRIGRISAKMNVDDLPDVINGRKSILSPRDSEHIVMLVSNCTLQNATSASKFIRDEIGGEKKVSSYIVRGF